MFPTTKCLSSQMFASVPLLYYLFVIIGFSSAAGQRRFDVWRRQTLPVEHLHIHSEQSNITIRDQIIDAFSADSVITLNKWPYNASLFSRSSEAEFDAAATFVRITARMVDLALMFQRMLFRSRADRGEMEMRVNPQLPAQSELRLRLADGVQFGVSDERSALRLFSSNGSQATFMAATDQRSFPRQLRINYENGSSVLRLWFTEEQSRASLAIMGAAIHLNYGNVFVQIDSDYRRLVILTNEHRLEFHTLGAPFQMDIGTEGMTIGYPSDKVQIQAGAQRNVTVDIGSYAKMDIRRGDGTSVFFRGPNSQSIPQATADSLEVIAARLALSLFAANDSVIFAQSEQSRLSLQTNSTEVLLASASHQIEIVGNRPFVLISTENVALVITSTMGQQPQIPALTLPDINFANFNLQNLSSLDQIPNVNWLTSKVNVNDLIGKEITPLQNFTNPLPPSVPNAPDFNFYTTTTQPDTQSFTTPNPTEGTPQWITTNNPTEPNPNETPNPNQPFPSVPSENFPQPTDQILPITTQPSLPPSPKTPLPPAMPQYPMTESFPVPVTIQPPPFYTAEPLPFSFPSTDEEFPTPAAIQTSIAETGFPMPPMIDPNVQTTDNFVIGQFESPTATSFPLLATITNITWAFSTTETPSFG